MSNETKRDVFEQALADWRDLVFDVGYQGEEFHGYCEFDAILSKYEKNYRTALPDNLPVIPEAVCDAIVKLKHKRFSLSGAMSYAAVVSLSSWMTLEHEEDFARAWLLGVWRVEGTGEIVKLETEE